MKQFKLGFGPMSKEIIDIMCEWSRDEDYPLMIIASRNQVDVSDGYVCNTNELVNRVKHHKTPKILLCRDHCGPYFADTDLGLTIDEAIVRCKQTIAEDIAQGFDLIHIDVSRSEEHTSELQSH
mgnify:FL=1